LQAWVAVVKAARWHGPNEVKAAYGNASILIDDRICFNIKANDYRLIVQFRYRAQVVYIKFIGTHKEYDAVNAGTVSMF
jgi:mRNA interferase HigB